MSKADFDMTGLEELSSKLMAAVEDFPGTAEKGLITIGNKLKQTPRKAARASRRKAGSIRWKCISARS